MEILGNLGINGKILLAQIVNFFLLMYLLKRFLYKPLLDIMQERQRRIKIGLRNADESEKRLREIEERSEKQFEKTAKEVDRILEKAHIEGEEHRKDIVREAQEEVTRIKEEAKSALQKEKERIIMDVRTEMGDLAVQIAKKIIKEKITDEDKKKLMDSVHEKMEESV